MALLEILNLLKSSKTLTYSDAQGIQPEARGVPVPLLRSEVDCASCSACVGICPTDVIRVEGKHTLHFDYGRCVQCGLCADVCAAGVIENSHLVDVFATDRARLCATFVLGSDPQIEPASSSDELRVFQNMARPHGFNYREVAASGNNTVECELSASFNNVFDSESIGVRSVASPKHADAVVYSGPVGPGMVGPLQTAWDCMPGPKALIAAGTEAISGGVHELGPLPAKPLLYVAGDPPRPDVLMRAFLFLRGQLKSDFADKLTKAYRDLIARRKI